MSKFALDGLTKCTALEMGEYGIRCNSVCPTVVLTAMGAKVWGDPEKGGPMLSKIPLNRFADEIDVVKPVMFLLNKEKSGMINAHSVPIEGGICGTLKM